MVSIWLLSKLSLLLIHESRPTFERILSSGLLKELVTDFKVDTFGSCGGHKTLMEASRDLEAHYKLTMVRVETNICI